MDIDGAARVSRRVALRASGGGAVALALRDAGVVRAQAATPTAERVPPIVQAWIDAWNADDPVTNLAALYTADAVYEDVPTGLSTVTMGTDVAGFVRAFVQEISDLAIQLRSGFGRDDHAAAEWDFRFRYTGQLPGLPPGTGQPILWHGATIFDLVGERIQRSADYYDNTGLLAAVGLLGMPVATPTS
jgi:steroid delta-isomerase-like uncharacterized protein